MTQILLLPEVAKHKGRPGSGYQVLSISCNIATEGVVLFNLIHLKFKSFPSSCHL